MNDPRKGYTMIKLEFHAETVEQLAKDLAEAAGRMADGPRAVWAEPPATFEVAPLTRENEPKGEPTFVVSTPEEVIGAIDCQINANPFATPEQSQAQEEFERVEDPNVNDDEITSISDPAPEFSDPEFAIITDSTGRIWDARIDSSNKKTIKDGTWQKRRNVTADVYTAVVQELAGLTNAPVSDGPGAPPAAAPVTADPTTLGELMTYCSANKIDPATLAFACKENGIASVPLLAKKPELIPAVFAALQ